MPADVPEDLPDDAPATSRPGQDPERRRRAEDAAAKAAMLERARAQESARAQALLVEFVAEATARGLAPVPLQARLRSGRGRLVRTGLVGWYLRRNHSVAVTPDARFYVLSAPGGWWTSLHGVHLDPSEPPLVLGRGGRDGESLDLAEAIALTLAQAPEAH